MHVRPTFQLRKEHEAMFKKTLLDGKPQMKGVVLKTVIKKPKKPNSGNRKRFVVDKHDLFQNQSINLF